MELGDIPGKGEKSLDPVDVDTIDNLLNAQAAYFEALDVAGEHFGVSARAVLTEEALLDVHRALGRMFGVILTHASSLRV